MVSIPLLDIVIDHRFLSMSIYSWLNSCLSQESIASKCHWGQMRHAQCVLPMAGFHFQGVGNIRYAIRVARLFKNTLQDTGAQCDLISP